MKVGFGIRPDAPIEEIEVDISSVEDESTEEPDVEGEVEVEEDSNDSGNNNKDDL